MTGRTIEPHPNVLLLTIDTLRADVLGSYGDPNLITPVLDRLARESLRFELAITGGSWTQAAFPPLLTSTYASMFGGCLGPLSPERPSPISALSDHGYTTIGVSSSPLLGRRYAYERGFRYFHELIPAESEPRLRRIKGGMRLLTRPMTHRIAQRLGRRLRPARRYGSAGEVNTRIVSELGNGRPFFGWIHYMDVHWPYHREEELEHPDEIAQAWKDVNHLYAVNWKNEKITSEQKAHYLNLYREAARFADAQFGELLARLEEMGLLEDTVIIVVSDHGEEFLERGKWGHIEVNLFDEIIRVPLIIRLPGGSTAGTIRQQVQTLDIMPTVLELCGCQAPEGMVGQSLAPLWGGGTGRYEDRPAISEMWRDTRHMIAARTSEHKLIWDSRNPGTPELYDLRTDPGERENIAGREPDLLQRLQQLVDQRLKAATASSPADPVEPPSHDEAMIRRLRDLGYLE